MEITKTITLPDEAATLRLGQALAEQLRGGDLGAGKATLFGFSNPVAYGFKGGGARSGDSNHSRSKSLGCSKETYVMMLNIKI